MKSKQLIGITIIIFFVFFLLSLNSNNMNNQANNNLQNETKELLQDNEASKGKSEYFTDPIVNEIGGTIEKRYKPPAVFERIPVEQDSFAYYLRNQIVNYQKKSNIKPLISSFCPAIVRLIQVRFPSLTENIIKLRTPKDLTAEIIIDDFTKQGFSIDEIGIFYITPCAAKIAAIKSPVGEEKSVINGVINMNSFFNMIMNKCNSNHYTEEELMEIQTTSLPPMAITWSLTRGEAQYVKGRSFAVDGIVNVCDFLEKIENDEIQDVDFLELRACDESCAGGILCTKNRFLTIESLYKRASISFNKRKNMKVNKDIEKLLINKMNITSIEPRPMNLDNDIEKAIKKLERIREIMCFLPNVDCGLCGAPNCKTLAEDITNNKAHISDCVFIQYKNLTDTEQAKNILTKIWGENIFEKDCSKKGAKYEGS